MIAWFECEACPPRAPGAPLALHLQATPAGLTRRLWLLRRMRDLWPQKDPQQRGDIVLYHRKWADDMPPTLATTVLLALQRTKNALK